MKILNIVLSAEIKYQQIEKLRKFRHKNFRSNFDPGKTHKGKTSERGLFIIYGLLRKNLLQHIHLQKFTQTYLDFLSQKILLNSPGKCSSISVPEIRTTVRLSQQLMLYGLSQKLCQNSAKTVRKTQQEQLLENRVVRPSKFVPNCTDCTKYTHKLITAVTSISVPINGCTTALRWVPNSSEILLLSPSISVHEKWLYGL
jgi:hypothetical protein